MPIPQCAFALNPENRNISPIYRHLNFKCAKVWRIPIFGTSTHVWNSFMWTNLCKQQCKVERNLHRSHQISKDFLLPLIWIRAYQCECWYDFCKRKNGHINQEKKMQRFSIFIFFMYILFWAINLWQLYNYNY